MSFGSRGPNEFFSQIRHRNAMKEIAREDAVQVLGMAMSTRSVRENGELLFISNVFYKLWHISACCFTSISRAWPPDKRKYLSPARSQIFAMEKK